jgi:hypothetical protein
MPKLSKKLLVYLDQNFISEMAKAPSNHLGKPQCTESYWCLQRGFGEEMLVAPQR